MDASGIFSKWGIKLIAFVGLSIAAVFTAVTTNFIQWTIDAAKGAAKTQIYNLNNWANPNWVISDDRYLDSAYVDLPYHNSAYCFDFVKGWGGKADLEVVQTHFVNSQPIIHFRKGEYNFEARCVSPKGYGHSSVVVYSVDSNGEIKEFYRSLANEASAQLGTLIKLQNTPSSFWASPNRASEVYELSMRIPEEEVGQMSASGLPKSVAQAFQEKGFLQNRCGKASCSFSKPAVSVLLLFRSAGDSNKKALKQAIMVVTSEFVNGAWPGPSSVAKDLISSIPNVQSSQVIGGDFD